MSTIKTNGAEFKAWQESDWGADAWWDDYVIVINGEEVDDYETDAINDSDKIVFHGGVVMFDQWGDKQMSAATHFRRWRKARTHATVSVEVARERLEELKAAVAALGGKVRA